MSLLDPAERTQRGVSAHTELWGKPSPEPTTLFESGWRDYIFAEVWQRPGLDRRSRYWIAIAGAANNPGPDEILEGYVRGALTTKEVTLPELREAVVQLAVYCGWSKGAYLDRVVTRVANELGLPPAPYAPFRAEPWDPTVRISEGRANFTAVMTFPGPVPKTAYFQGGILNFVFGEMWMRPGLDQRSRRWITLVGVADAAAEEPIRTHVYAAMASGNATVDEMYEFILQYAVHSSWPKASVVQTALIELAKRVTEGQDYVSADGTRREQPFKED